MKQGIVLLEHPVENVDRNGSRSAPTQRITGGPVEASDTELARMFAESIAARAFNHPRSSRGILSYPAAGDGRDA